MIKYRIDNFKEDLPKFITSKKGMKRFKLWGLVIIVVIISVAIVIGALENKASENSKNDILTLKTIVKTFKSQNLHVKEDKSKAPNDFALKGIKPSIYRIGDDKDTILIYIFKSFREREDILRETNKYNNPYSFEEVPYYAKNAFIVFIPSEIPKTEEDFVSIFKIRRLISDTVFKYLNDGKERVYKGESTSWEGTYTFKYYEHWIEDENGLHYDSYSQGHPVIKYKMSDIGNVGPITLEHGGGSSTGLTLNKEGYADCGFGGGSILDEKAVTKFTIKWGDKEDHIVLKAE